MRSPCILILLGLGCRRATASSDFDDPIGLGSVYNAPPLKPHDHKEKPKPGNRKGDKLVVGDSSMLKCQPDYSLIDDALADFEPGDTIELCEGVFHEAVTIPPDLGVVKITGKGKGKSIIKPPPGKDVVLAAGPGTGFELEKVTLDGDKKMAGNVPAVAGIVCISCNAKVTDVEIISIQSIGDSVPSIHIFARSEVAGSGNIEVQRTVMPDVGALGIFMDGPGMSGTLMNNEITRGNPDRSDRFIGIQVSRQAMAKVEGNSVRDFKSQDLRKPSTAINTVCPGFKTEVKKNKIDSSDLGMTLILSSKVKVQDNEISNTLAGVSIEFQPITTCPMPNVMESNRVTKNKIMQTQVLAIRLASSVEQTITVMRKNKIRQNEIKETGSIGMLVETGDRNQFIENKIEESTVFGIGVAAGSDCLYKKNDIKQSGIYGMAFAGGEGNDIRKNNISSNSGSGIGIQGGRKNVFRKNDIKESKLNGVDVVAGENNRFFDNKIEDFGDYGLFVIGGSGNAFIDNKIKNGGIARTFTNTTGNTFSNNDRDVDELFNETSGEEETGDVVAD